RLVQPAGRAARGASGRREAHARPAPWRGDFAQAGFLVNYGTADCVRARSAAKMIAPANERTVRARPARSPCPAMPTTTIPRIQTMMTVAGRIACRLRAKFLSGLCMAAFTWLRLYPLG